jgi:hypothetical protein
MNKLLTLVITSLCSLTSCEYADDRLTVVNNTDHTISIATFHDTIPDSPALNKPAYYLSNGILPGKSTSQALFGSKTAWYQEIRLSKNKQLNIFMYTNDTLAKRNDMSYPNAKRLYHRISLTQAQLDASNWKVKFFNK